MSRTRVVAAVVALLVVATVGVVWATRESRAPLALETSDGVTFLRQRDLTDGDDVAHSGRLFVGDDGCLYVTPEDGETYLVVLGPGSEVASDAVEVREGALELDAPATFARRDVEGTLPARVSTLCTLAQEPYGVA